MEIAFAEVTARNVGAETINATKQQTAVTGLLEGRSALFRALGALYSVFWGLLAAHAEIALKPIEIRGSASTGPLHASMRFRLFYRRRMPLCVGLS